jgi:hypothetical protein
MGMFRNPMRVVATVLGLLGTGGNCTATKTPSAGSSSTPTKGGTNEPSGACRSVAASVATIYDFNPRKVGDDLRERKSKEMDAFWKGIQADASGESRACLVEELERPGANGFFLFDGADLLANSSRHAAQLQVAADAMARADLEDVDPYGFTLAVNGLACKGADTTGAARAALRRDDFKIYAFRAPHLIQFAKEDALVFMIAPMDDERAAAAVHGWLADPSLRSVLKDIVTVGALLFQPKVQDDFRRLLDQDKSLLPDVRRTLETVSSLERHTGKPALFTRADWERRVEQGTQQAAFTLDSDEELTSLKELTRAGDLPKLRALGRAILCSRRVNQHALAEYGAIGEMLQIALSEGKN